MEDPALSNTHSFAIKLAALGWVLKCPNYSVVSALAGPTWLAVNYCNKTYLYSCCFLMEESFKPTALASKSSTLLQLGMLPACPCPPLWSSDVPGC